MISARLCFSAALALLCAAPSFARIEREVEKTFTVSPGGTLKVSTFGGNINVEPGSGNQVVVKARQVFSKADNEREADQIAEDLEMTIEQRGNDVTAQARYHKNRFGGFRWGSTPVNVSFTVVVPSRFNVDLDTSGGNIEVGDLEGEAKVQTSGGNLRFGRFQGPVEGRTSGGNISIDEARDRLKVSTSGGNIRVGRASGEVNLRTSGGAIRVDRVAGTLDASTSGGSVQANVEGPVKGDVTLSTSGGSVDLRVEPSAAFRLDASTSGGRVQAEGLTVQLESGGAGRDRLVGAVNGGGPTVRLRSSGGNINVKPL